MLSLAIAQLVTSSDKDRSLATIESLCRDAALRGARLVVLPEEAVCQDPGSDADLAALAEPLDGPAVTRLRAIAAEHRITLVAGLYERRPGQEKPYNTLVVVDPHAGLVAAHRKTHLYDAFQYRESDRVTAGDGAPVVVTVEGIRVGIVNCYEVRFPERARLLVDAGADVLAVSAAWASGPLKEEHWRLCVRSRAIENTVWVAASGSLGEETVGRSLVADPLGVVRAELDERGEGIAIVPIDLDRTREVRRTLPILEQRRAITRDQAVA